MHSLCTAHQTFCFNALILFTNVRVTQTEAVTTGSRTMYVLTFSVFKVYTAIARLPQGYGNELLLLSHVPWGGSSHRKATTLCEHRTFNTLFLQRRKKSKTFNYEYDTYIDIGKSWILKQQCQINQHGTESRVSFISSNPRSCSSLPLAGEVNHAHQISTALVFNESLPLQNGLC